MKLWWSWKRPGEQDGDAFSWFVDRIPFGFGWVLVIVLGLALNLAAVIVIGTWPVASLSSVAGVLALVALHYGTENRRLRARLETTQRDGDRRKPQGW